MLASSVQRSKPAPYPSKARSALIRRTVVVILVLVALTLVTISFRSPTAGALHDLQGAGSSALRPFQIAGTRVGQPFKDAYDYVASLAHAKAENKRLKAQIAEYRRDVLITAAKLAKYPAYEKLLRLEQGPRYPKDYRTVNAQVVSSPGGPFTHTVTIAAGSAEGIRLNAPVVSGGGLVGRVSNVFSHTAKVTLLTDLASYAAARDLHHDVRGGIKAGPGGTLVMTEVPKQDRVERGDWIVTDGTHSARYPDLYPYGIPIGRVVYAGASDTSTFLQVQVQPLANFGSLDAVGVLVSTNPRR
jgi:rod shape-determining protein MreC